jgi:hypothetical protein
MSWRRSVRRSLNRVGLDLLRADVVPVHDDIGRTYADDPGAMPRFVLTPASPTPWAGEPTTFCITSDRGTAEEVIFYSHLTLLKMIKHFDFDTVLDIGSHERRCSRVFEHCGKKVITVEVAPGYPADYKVGYLDVTLPSKVDAIWCSQTLEHQRNIGVFLKKMFDDLVDGGVLAITVPYQIGSDLFFGHCNQFSPLLLVYQLVCAGFDCRDISLRCYNGNIGAILRKRYNGIDQSLPMGTLPGTPDKNDVITQGGITGRIRDLLGSEVFAGMEASFPLALKDNVLQWRSQAINWGEPI